MSSTDGSLVLVEQMLAQLLSPLNECPKRLQTIFPDAKKIWSMEFPSFQCAFVVDEQVL